VAKDEVQKVLQLTEGRRSQWEKAWEDQKSRLEHNLQICQFYFDLRQVIFDFLGVCVCVCVCVCV